MLLFLCIQNVRVEDEEADDSKFRSPKSEIDQKLFLISFSLYGDDPRYVDGAIENAFLVREVYSRPWKMRVYYDSTVPAGLLDTLRRLDVEVIDMTASSLPNRMCWRFLPASEPGVARFLSRDIDSRLSAREALAVSEWERSGLPFHVMRDHPSHCHEPILGGMWGAVGGAVSDMADLLRRDALGASYG